MQKGGKTVKQDEMKVWPLNKGKEILFLLMGYG